MALLGTDEIAQGVVKLKRLADGEEFTVNREDVAGKVTELLG